MDFSVSLAFLELALLESLPLRASGALLLERDLILVSLAFFISLPLRAASGARLLERDLVLVNTPLGPSTPVNTQDSSRYFLPRNGTWPSSAVTMSSSLVGDPQRDGSRILYSLRPSDSGESPLVYSEFLSRWLMVCKRTSSMLAGEPYEPYDGEPYAWSRLCGQPSAFTTACTTSCSTSPPQLTTSSTRFDTLCPAADPLAAPKVATAIVVFDTFVSGAGTNKTRRREIRGEIAVSTRNTWCPDTVGIF